MTLEVRPGHATADAPGIASAYAERSCQGRAIHALGVQFAHRPDLLHAELRPAVGLAPGPLLRVRVGARPQSTRNALRVRMAPVPLAPRSTLRVCPQPVLIAPKRHGPAAASSVHVRHVVGRRSRSEVSRVAAGRVVTDEVPDDEALAHGTVDKGPRDAVGIGHLRRRATHTKAAVAEPMASRHPRPAGVRPSRHVHLGPEAVSWVLGPGHVQMIPNAVEETER